MGRSDKGKRRKPETQRVTVRLTPAELRAAMMIAKDASRSRADVIATMIRRQLRSRRKEKPSSWEGASN